MLLTEQIAEQLIIAARDRGELDNLPGQGRPLALDDDSAVPPELRASYRILKNSGYIPAEVEQLRQVRQVESLLAQAESDNDKKTLLLKLSLLRSKLPSLQLATAGTQRYRDKILQRLYK